MKKLPFFLGALCLAVVCPPLAGGEFMLEGTVTLPKEKPAPPPSARYQGNATEAVATPEPATAVVYLEGKFPTTDPPPPAQLPQKGFQFKHSLLAVRKGTRVEFPNEDEAYHNVFSYSKPKRFDLGRYRKGETPAFQIFDQEGVVKLYCEIHSHMRATILVLDTPHFIRTEPSGHYRLALTNVPPGTYTLKAWINEKTTRESTVEIKDSGSLKVDFPG